MRTASCAGTRLLRSIEKGRGRQHAGDHEAYRLLVRQRVVPKLLIKSAKCLLLGCRERASPGTIGEFEDGVDVNRLGFDQPLSKSGRSVQDRLLKWLEGDDQIGAILRRKRGDLFVRGHEF